MVQLPVTYRVISRNLWCNFLVWIRTYTTLIGLQRTEYSGRKEDNEDQGSNSWWFREKLPHVYREISQTWRPNFPAWITTCVHNEVLFAHGRHFFCMHVWLAGRHGICYACMSSVALYEFETGLYCRRSAAGSHVGPALQPWAAYSGIQNEDITSCHAGNYEKNRHFNEHFKACARFNAGCLLCDYTVTTGSRLAYGVNTFSPILPLRA